MTMTKEKRRTEWIDSAKAIGIILVVYGHVILGLHDSSINYQGLGYDLQHRVIYSLHMPLFFFLSGLFAKKWVRRPINLAIKQKAYSLLRPYLIWGIIQGIIMQLLSTITNNGQGLADVLLLPIRPYAQFWYLYDLFFIFLIYYVLTNLIKLNEHWLLLLAICLFLISPYLNFWETGRIAYHFVFFILATGNYQKFLAKRKLAILLPTVIVVNFIYFLVNPNSLIGLLSVFVVASLGILFVSRLSQVMHNSLLNKIGRSSLAIYVMHIFATAGSRIILLKLQVEQVWLHLVIGTLAGLFLPMLAEYLIKKTKLDKILL